MAKQKITDKLQAKFDRPQFREGDAVYFSWLGQKKYGYVLRFKKSNWGICYTIQSTCGTRYPCGIRIDGIPTTYNVGLILFNETKEFGAERLNKIINGNGATVETSGILEHTRWPEVESRISDTPSQSDVDSTIGTVHETTSRKHSRKNDVGASNNTVPRNNRKKSKPVKNAELTNAIQRQKDFLNGFVKRD